MNRYTFAVLSLAAGLLAGSCGVLNAGAPLKINFQGRLNESGQPAEGTKTFVFKLYDAASGGTLVWTSQSQSIALSQGMFSASLAAGTPAAISTASFAGARYVEMTVDGVTLSPRQEMTSAPYALVAQALAADADIPPTAIAPGSVRDSHVALSTGAVSSGRFADDRVLITTGAFASLNGADQLVKLDGAGKMPAVDGSALTNLAAAQVPSLDASKITTGKFYDVRLAVSTGAFPGGFNGASQLLQLDGSGLVPDADIPGLATSKITSGVFNDNRLAVSTGAFPGGFNAANQLVRLDGTSKLPAVDGSALTNLAAAQVPSLDASKISTGKFYDVRLAVSTGAFPGGFNGANQLLQLDGSGLVPDADIPGLAASKITAGVFNDNRLAISTGAFPGGFNGNDQLLKLDGSGLIPDADIPGLATSKITSGVFNDNRLAVSTGAFPGGFNAANQLVRLDGTSKLPAVDGSALTNLAAAQVPSLDASKISTGKFYDVRLAVSTGAFPGGFNGIDQLLQLDGSGLIPDADIPGLDTSKITSGVFNDNRLAVSTGAFPGGFNGNDQLLKLDGSGLIPDADIPGLATSKITSGVFNDNRLAISTGAFPGGFNGNDQLLKLDGSGLIPDADIPGLATSKITSGVFNDVRVAISTGAFPGGFNGADKLAKFDSSGRLAVGVGTANSVLSVGGALSLAVSTVSTTGSAVDVDYSVTANDSTIIAYIDSLFDVAININLPDATTALGRVYTIYRPFTNGASNSVNIVPYSSQNIGSLVSPANVLSLDFTSDFTAVTIQSIGDSWIVISKNP